MEAVPGEEEGQESVPGLGIGRWVGGNHVTRIVADRLPSLRRTAKRYAGSLGGHEVAGSDTGVEKILVDELVGFPHSRCTGAGDSRVVAAIGLAEQFDAGFHTLDPVNSVVPVHCGPLTIECRFHAEPR